MIRPCANKTCETCARLDKKKGYCRRFFFNLAKNETVERHNCLGYMLRQDKDQRDV